MITKVIDVKKEGQMTVFELATSEKLINQTILWIPIEWLSYVAVLLFFIKRMVYLVLKKADDSIEL